MGILLSARHRRIGQKAEKIVLEILLPIGTKAREVSLAAIPSLRIPSKEVPVTRLSSLLRRIMAMASVVRKTIPT